MIYCVIPRELATRLHGPLRAHFRGDPSVTVVVEARELDRRAPERRSEQGEAPQDERRQIRAEQGRRMADRRALTESVEAPPLPRRLRRYAESLTFVERLEPSSERLRDIDTARLVIRSQAGDMTAFKTIYLRYFDPVYNYVRVVMGGHEDTEDVAQDIFLKAFEALPRYVSRPDKPFRAWLFRIARNTAVDSMKKLGTLQLEEPEAIDRRVESEEAERAALALDWASDSDLLFLIERLPPLQRQALVLKYIVGLSRTEVANVMGKSPDSVSQLQYRARRFLEERLAAIQGRESRASRRSPMLIRLRRMPVLGARRAPVAARCASSPVPAPTPVRSRLP